METSNSRFVRFYAMGFALVFFSILLLPLLMPGARFASTDVADFYGRARLVAWATDLRLALGDRVFPKVLVGADGWLFYSAELSIEDYQNTIPLKNRMVEILQGLSELKTRLDSRGIRLVIVIAPNKTSIYPQYMPVAVPVIGKRSRFDQLQAQIKANGGDPLLDFRPILRDAAQSAPVYYKTDTHWNDDGAYLAYAEIIRAAGQLPRPLDGFTRHSLGLQTLDLAANLGSSQLKEEKFSLTPKDGFQAKYIPLALANGRQVLFSRMEDQSLPKAVVFHDSFFFSVIPFLGEHFSQAAYIPHYSGESWTLAWIDQYNPDVVIIEFAERYIHDIPRLTNSLR